jgi:23S rRNA pseudouridine1911/1915/1917 synthase
LQTWINGFVTVDGKVAKRKDTVYGDEKIVILPQAAPEDEAFKPEAMELNIVFEDEHLIVINKPAGLVVHPGAGNWSGTLLNGLLHHCPQLAGVPRAGIVHRLDKDTSGLMVVGKTLAAQTDLVRQLAGAHRQARVLCAGVGHAAQRHHRRVHGPPPARPGQDGRVENTAKPAITHYELIGSGELDRRPVSLVQCRLETGRTHQIRVHMQRSALRWSATRVWQAAPGVRLLAPGAAGAPPGLVHPGTRKRASGSCRWPMISPNSSPRPASRAGTGLMTAALPYIPHWPGLPANVGALATVRAGGVSQDVW